MKWKSLIPLLPAAAVLASLCLGGGCANTSTAPSGGPKDTIPPYLVDIKPLPDAVGVPCNTQVVFKFNEYVVVKNPQSIYLSPPQKKAPKWKMRGKSVVVYFEEPLLPNTTYSLDITGAIQDNNENNPYPGFTLVFSTGERLDSMMVSGIVQDCSTLMPVKGATVMLYKDASDSALFLHRPDAAAKTDDWGYFCLRNIQDTLYRVYAVMDANNDNIYQMDNERVAFLDSAFRPTTVVRDTLPELLKYDMKDTAACLARKVELELNLFREKPSRQFIVKKERVAERAAYLTFMAPNAQVNGMRIKGLPKDRLISQFNPERDSLELWVNDQRRMPDTLQLLINYLKTASTGVLVPTDEIVRLALDKKQRAAASKSSRRDRRHEDTICVYTAKAEPETVEQYGFTLEFKYPIIRDGFDRLVLRTINPRQKEADAPFTVTRDSTNLRRYTVMPKEKLLQGWEYRLRVPERIFRDINGFWNDSTVVKVSLPNDEKLSSLTLDLSGVGSGKYIIDLLNDKRDKVLRSYVVEHDCPVAFPYLRAGIYSVRITEDLNRNGIVDTGDLLTHRQPEKVRFYKISGSDRINVPERAEMQQSVNLKDLFAR